MSSVVVTKGARAEGASIGPLGPNLPAKRHVRSALWGEGPEDIHPRSDSNGAWAITTVADEATALATAYGLSGTPMYVFVDEEGVVRWRYAGELPIERLEEAIAAIR